jgi:thiol-disulfide isomerase/thioredoxin
MKSTLFILLLITGLTGFGQSLPDFSFMTSEGILLNKASLKQDQPVIVIYFDSYCEPCIKQAEAIKKSSVKFTNTTIIWASWAEIEDLKAFKAAYFSNSNSIIAVKDVNFMFDRWFGYSESPTIFVYNSTWNLSAKFVKETSAEDLLGAIK